MLGKVNNLVTLKPIAIQNLTLEELGISFQSQLIAEELKASI